MEAHEQIRQARRGGDNRHAGQKGGDPGHLTQCLDFAHEHVDGPKNDPQTGEKPDPRRPEVTRTRSRGRGVLGDVLPLDEQVQPVKRKRDRDERPGEHPDEAWPIGDWRVDDREREGHDDRRDGDHVELGLLVDDGPAGFERLAARQPGGRRDDEHVEDGRADDRSHTQLEDAQQAGRDDTRKLRQTRPDGHDDGPLHDGREAVGLGEPGRRPFEVAAPEPDRTGCKPHQQERANDREPTDVHVFDSNRERQRTTRFRAPSEMHVDVLISNLRRRPAPRGRRRLPDRRPPHPSPSLRGLP